MVRPRSCGVRMPVSRISFHMSARSWGRLVRDLSVTAWAAWRIASAPLLYTASMSVVERELSTVSAISAPSTTYIVADFPRRVSSASSLVKRRRMSSALRSAGIQGPDFAVRRSRLSRGFPVGSPTCQEVPNVDRLECQYRRWGSSQPSNAYDGSTRGLVDGEGGTGKRSALQ